MPDDLTAGLIGLACFLLAVVLLRKAAKEART